MITIFLKILNRASDNVAAFKIAFHNINSLPMKLTTFMNECDFFYNFEILGFCEIKLSCDIVQLFHHYSLYTNNVSRDKGGVALYIHNQHQSRQRSDLDCMVRFYLTIQNLSSSRFSARSGTFWSSGCTEDRTLAMSFSSITYMIYLIMCSWKIKHVT